MFTLREVRELLDTDNNTQRVLSKKELDQKGEEIVAKKNRRGRYRDHRL